MSEIASFRFEGTRVRVGAGCRSLLPECFEGASRVALVLGGAAMRRQGFVDEILEGLPGAPELFEGVDSNPQVDQIQELATFLGGSSPEVVVALGGGSVLDAAKAANLAAGEAVTVRELVEGSPPGRLRGLARTILLPTTAGTGSEVTPFAVLWDRARDQKYSLDRPEVQGDWALVDPELARGLPLAWTRGTAGDALTHAFESLWARAATPLSDAHASEAVRRVRSAVEAMAEEAPAAPAEVPLRVRANLAWGSCLAGMSISTTRTAAAHALSYGLTNRFAVPHGTAVVTLLPEVLRASWPKLSGELRERLASAWGETQDELVDSLAGFVARHELGAALGEYGVGSEHLEALAEAADVPGRMDNHAAALTRDDLVGILEACR